MVSCAAQVNEAPATYADLPVNIIRTRSIWERRLRLYAEQAAGADVLLVIRRLVLMVAAVRDERHFPVLLSARPAKQTRSAARDRCRCSDCKRGKPSLLRVRRSKLSSRLGQRPPGSLANPPLDPRWTRRLPQNFSAPNSPSVFSASPGFLSHRAEGLSVELTEQLFRTCWAVPTSSPGAFQVVSVLDFKRHSISKLPIVRVRDIDSYPSTTERQTAIACGFWSYVAISRQMRLCQRPPSTRAWRSCALIWGRDGCGTP